MTSSLFNLEKPDFSYEKCETYEQLTDYLKRLIEYPTHDYNTATYTVTKSLLAVEHFIAHMLGTTGAQHGYARLAYLREAISSKTGIAILDFDQLLYPQYDLLDKATKWIDKMRRSDEIILLARERIKEDDESELKAHPDVRKRWEELAKQQTKSERNEKEAES